MSDECISVALWQLSETVVLKHAVRAQNASQSGLKWVT